MSPHPAAAPTWALLDDGLAAAGDAASRLYTGHGHTHVCRDPAELDALWAQVQAQQNQGWHAVLLVDYEWGARLQAVAEWPDAAGQLTVLMFQTLKHLNEAQVQAWLAAQEPASPGQPAAQASQTPGPAAVLDAQPSVDRAGFDAAIGQIHAAIRAGETYQVNYTYRWDGQLAGHPVALYRRLRATQPVAFGACIALPPQTDGAQGWLLSRSPELFLQHQPGAAAGEGWIETRPMKGTAPRQADPVADAQAGQALALDVKNRAENLMIVDLLRNDLGRVARLGSVQVPALFQVEPLATVFQMTSTVRAQPLPGLDVPGLLRATFPCGSITGAPKRHTMGLIRQLESTPRGPYCGAIGWVDAPPPGGGLPALAWSVAIRTLQVHTQPAQATRLRWGVGGGIVLDSVAASEHDESLWKSRFVFACNPGFELIETLRLLPDGQLPWLEDHLARLRRSAARLRWPLDEAAVRQTLLARAAELVAACSGPAAAAATPWRLRLTLAFDGTVGLSHAPLPALPQQLSGEPVTLLLAPEPLPVGQPLSGLKTTVRQPYDAGVRAAEAQGAFDSLFLNTAGEVVEGGRSNLFVQLDGRWYTPPLASGALPGVARARVLADPAWAAQERVLRLADLHAAQALMVCNALRGCLPACWHPSGASAPRSAEQASDLEPVKPGEAPASPQ